MIEGPYARRKFWQMFTVSGGKVDDSGVSIGWKISKGSFRAMIDSALGLDPKDMSEAAKAKRVLRGLADLAGITFVAWITVEASSDARYGDSNKLGRVDRPDRAGVAPGDGRRGRAAGARHPVPREARSVAAQRRPGTRVRPQHRGPAPCGPPRHRTRTRPNLPPRSRPSTGPAWLNG